MTTGRLRRVAFVDCSCADCDRTLVPRSEIRERAIRWAASIEAETSDGHRSAFASYGLLLIGELAIRCEACATARLAVGVTAIAQGDPT